MADDMITIETAGFVATGGLSNDTRQIVLASIEQRHPPIAMIDAAAVADAVAALAPFSGSRRLGLMVWPNQMAVLAVFEAGAPFPPRVGVVVPTLNL